MAQKTLKLNIRKKWCKDHGMLGASLERLMTFYDQKANSLLVRSDGDFLTKPRPQDKEYYDYCKGVVVGLNMAWKLIFGTDSEKNLKQ